MSSAAPHPDALGALQRGGRRAVTFGMPNIGVAKDACASTSAGIPLQRAAYSRSVNTTERYETGWAWIASIP